MSYTTIRRGTERDLDAINDIYNYYIAETAITFDIQPWNSEKRHNWFQQFDTSGPYQLFVADDGENVVGFAYSAQFRPKAAYDPSVEVTVYLVESAKSAGLGTKLYAALFAALAGADVHRAYAGIAVPNPASVALHKKVGFELAGRFSEVGRKFDRYVDVEWFEKRLR